VTITYPEAEYMDENDPNYSKAGQTIVEEEPVYEEIEIVVENAYVIISNYALIKEEYPEIAFNNGEQVNLGMNKKWILNLHAKIYESKEAREADPDSNIHYEDRSIELGIVNDSIFNLAYGSLKNEKGFQELQHDI
jgi:hypothetical protein